MVLSEQGLAAHIDGELERVVLARRVGVLAAIEVAELPELRSRLGSGADVVVTAALEKLIARDDKTLELHSLRSQGGFWILLPETGFYEADQLLQQLSRRLVETVVDVGGERLRVTPVIGYATFADATSATALCDRASAALHIALLNLDLVPVKYSRALALASAGPDATRGRLMLAKRLWSPLRVAFVLSVLLELPFIAYVLSWHAGFDLTSVTYPLMVAVLAATSLVIWIASFRAASTRIENLAISAPVAFHLATAERAPVATAVVAAHLPSESAIVVDTVTALLEHEYPGALQVILAYTSPKNHPIETSLDEIAGRDPRLVLCRIEGSTSKAECVSAALEHTLGEFVGIFDADNRLAQGSFIRVWQKLSDGYDIVQGHRVARNGDVSWVTRLVAVDLEATQASSQPGRLGLQWFGVFGGPNSYWRTDTLREIGTRRQMQSHRVHSSDRGSQRGGLTMAFDPLLMSSELAPSTLKALWRQRAGWAQGAAHPSYERSRAVSTSDGPGSRQFRGRTPRSSWMQMAPWLAVEVVPILGFIVWRDGGFGRLSQLIPLVVVLAVFALTVGAAQGTLAYLLGDPRMKRHRGWFVLYALHSAVWFDEFKDLASRIAPIKEPMGDRHLRGTDPCRNCSGPLISPCSGRPI